MVRWRRRLSPLQLSHLATLSLLLVLIFAAIGAWLRLKEGVWSRPGLGVLLTLLALVVGIAGAVVKARASSILVVFSPRRVRAMAIASLVAGLVAMLLACVVASGSPSGSGGLWQRVIGEAVLAAGMALGLAGFATLFWAFGLDYLGARIEDRSDEHW